MQNTLIEYDIKMYDCENTQKKEKKHFNTSIEIDLLTKKSCALSFEFDLIEKWLLT